MNNTVADKNYISGKMKINIDNGEIVECDKELKQIFGIHKGYSLLKEVNLFDPVKITLNDILNASVFSQLESGYKAFTRNILKDTNGENTKCYEYVEIVAQENGTEIYAVVTLIFYLDNKEVIKTEKKIEYGDIPDVFSEEVEIPIGVLEKDFDGDIKVVRANREFYRILGFTDEKEFNDSCDGYLRNTMILLEYMDFKRFFEKPFEEMEIKNLEARIENNSNDIFKWVKFRIVSGNKRDEYFRYIAVVYDISKTKKLEEQVNIFVTSNEYGKFQKDVQYEYDVKMDVFRIPMYGEKKKEYLSVHNFREKKRWRFYIERNDWVRFEINLEKAVNGHFYGSEVYGISLFNESVVENCRVYGKLIMDSQSRVTKIVGRIVNIEAENEAKNRLMEKSKIDPISGLYNKYHVSQKINKILREKTNKESDAFLLVRIDNYQKLNDVFGSIFINALVQSIGIGLGNLFRKDDIMGRVSKDLFVIFIKGLSRDIVLSRASEINNLIKNICNSGNENFDGSKNELLISNSIGIAYSDSNLERFKELLEKAYIALGFSKKNIQNRVIEYGQYMLGSYVELPDFDDEEFYQIETYDKDFISYAFNLLVNYSDIKIAVNSLIERIGKRYNLSCVFILENFPSKQRIEASNLWNNGYFDINIDDVSFNFKDWRDVNGRFDERGVIVFDNYKNVNDIACLKRIVGNKAMVICELNRVDKADGYAIFVDRRDEYKWQDYEIDSFHEISKVLNVFNQLDIQKHINEEKINELSQKDSLTGLMNINAFKERVEEIIKKDYKPGKYAIVYSDFNDFSYFNDNFGHIAGDEILKRFSRILSKNVDTIACRIYSDYFLTFVKFNTEEFLKNRISEVNRLFAADLKANYPQIDFRLSTGLYILTEEKEEVDLDTAIDNANQARKNCKARKALYIKYNDEMRRIRQFEQSLVVGLNDAIKKGEFCLYLQPKFLLGSNEVIGAEALVRWHQEDGTLHFPDEFIPIFERVGHIIEIDYYIYEQVLMSLKKWKKDGKKLIPVSVNFSRVHFYYENFVDDISKLASFYDVDYNLIEIEVTESSFNDNVDKMLEVFEKLRALGFKIDMDDFGTGYSSLSMLINAPVDIVKVDKSFMFDENSDKGKKYVRQIGGLIQAADKQVIFEGVETKEQEKFLLDCGYEMAQGFLFDRPICLKEFEEKYIY
ncbi:diguanylate cyclase (GGDEF) domain-containing protein [Acetitomaculum ruminis DSM 5522]|uniref:Diguanylate cyclase (GGDEF) domain-containing protein n=1 Tax=Acetitomaculum ruminis DSM 5522 TaxID=1120918 RepID=A0A1I0UYR8_9FIRM|nr:EAL domain-containing protein [Acetitomaculum ruminis]SFA69178.1 diguanylate cyclase (GGDEF) domain-containing protein [Acetitomaculum ruminis DSM 5522]